MEQTMHNEFLQLLYADERKVFEDMASRMRVSVEDLADLVVDQEVRRHGGYPAIIGRSMRYELASMAASRWRRLPSSSSEGCAS